MNAQGLVGRGAGGLDGESGQDRQPESDSDHREHCFVAGSAENDPGVDAVGGEGLLDGRLCAVRRPGDNRRPVKFGEVDGAIRKAPTGCCEAVRVVQNFDVFDVGIIDSEVAEEQVDG